MTINIIGSAPSVNRIETGLYTFDHAFENRNSDIGFPLGKGIEVYGPTNCGKSTIVYGLSGIIASEQERYIALADLEGFDPDFLITVLENAGYSGDLQYIQDENDEDVLDKLIVFMKDNNYCVGILDSIGAISPISEQKGSIGEANMGRRALILAQFTRKCLKLLRQPDAPSIFMINHEYPRIGGLGSDTPGGQVKKYLASMRVKVKRVYYKNKYAEYPDGSYVIEGKVIKNRWGYKDRTFWLDRNQVKIGDEKFGHIKKFIQQAQEGNEEPFEPFYKLLEEYEEPD
jgi:RecA/RadA recombinase